MKTFILISIIFFIFNTTGFSQTIDYVNIKRNSVYAEGYLIRHDFSDGFVSINYERNIGNNLRTYLRVGAYPDFNSSVSFPLTVSWVTKPLGHHHFEYGIGAVYRIEHGSEKWYFDRPAFMIPLMYRYQEESSWFFRVGINLFLSDPILPSPSITAGYKF